MSIKKEIKHPHNQHCKSIFIFFSANHGEGEKIFCPTERLRKIRKRDKKFLRSLSHKHGDFQHVVETVIGRNESMLVVIWWMPCHKPSINFAMIYVKFAFSNQSAIEHSQNSLFIFKGGDLYSGFLHNVNHNPFHYTSVSLTPCL